MRPQAEETRFFLSDRLQYRDWGGVGGGPEVGSLSGGLFSAGVTPTG